MANQAKTNRAQKNTVRVALTTAATIATLFGAQALAFAGNSPANAQAQDPQPVVNAVPSTSNDNLGSESDVTGSTRSFNRISRTRNQPVPSSHSSR